MALQQNHNFIELTKIDSTNLEARRLVESGKVPDGVLVITAKSQTSGKGRLGRSWISQEGNLFMSAVVRESEATALYPFISAIAVGEALSGFTEEKLSYKWPNDVLLDNKKVSGVLIEVFNKYVIIGIGVNILNYPENNTRLPATCLKNYANKPVGVREILDPLVYNLDKWLHADNADIIKEWMRLAYGINRNITVDQGALGKISGVFRGVDTNGLLILEVDKGRKELIHVGDVTF